MKVSECIVRGPFENVYNNKQIGKVKDYQIVSMNDDAWFESSKSYNEAVRLAKIHSIDRPNEVIRIYRWLFDEEYDSVIDETWERNYKNGKEVKSC